MTTTEQIVSILYRLVNGSALAAAVSGSIYTAEDRPADSVLEDITIGVVGNRPSQFQRGTAYVNIYVPKTRKGDALIRNRERIDAIEPVVALLLEHVLTSEYHFDLVDQRVQEVQGIDQHCIINELSFTFVNF